MTQIDKISIALPRDMVDSIKEAVESGQYATTSEVVRDALRAWHHKRALEVHGLAELRQMIQDGIDSGPSVDAQAVFARLKAKYATAAKGKNVETRKIVPARRKRS